MKRTKKEKRKRSREKEREEERKVYYWSKVYKPDGTGSKLMCFTDYELMSQQTKMIRTKYRLRSGPKVSIKN